MDHRLQARIDAILDEWNVPESPGCALGIVHKGELIFAKGYGCANLEYGVPITPQTIFHIGSVSKQFTAMCIALLEEAGKVSLEDNIRTYIPELPPYRQTITVGHLIHMTSGLRDLYFVKQYLQGACENDLFTEEEAFEIICNLQDTIFPPGEQFWYCNSGYFLLGLLVRRLTNQSLAEYAEENIFKPLGMHNTFFREDRTEIIKNRAEGYCKYDYLHSTEQLRSKRRHHLSLHCIAAENCELPGAGQVWSNIEDLHRWVCNFSQNKLGKGGPSLIEKITTSGTLNNGEACGYGHGLFLTERKGAKVIYHEGGSVGHNAVIYCIPAEDLSVICLANTNYFLGKVYRDLGMEITELITDELLGSHEVAEEVTTPLPMPVEAHDVRVVRDLLRNIKEFQNPETSTIWKISCAHRKLIVDVNGERTLELYPLDATTFQTSDASVIVRFEINESNELCKIHLKNQATERESVLLPFSAKPVSAAYLSEYTGRFCCAELKTTYIVEAKGDRLFMYNEDRHKYSMDFYYEPSIPDYFYTYNPPYISCYYSISFLRDDRGIQGFVFRDYDGDQREIFEFKKC